MRLSVDAMGGDFAPREIVAGVVEAARLYPGIERILLVGDQAAVTAELNRHGPVSPKIEVVHASQVVGMDESPASAIRRKKDSSIARAMDLVKSGEADAVFSAGNTGAAVAAATLKLRTLPGIDRPAIATVIPTPTKPFIMLDAGANTDCTPHMLAQFAVMGDVYSRQLFGLAEPRIGLLSIGEEDAKGNDTTKEAFRILDASPFNFVGNVESADLFEGRVDVVACDGFVGNVVLKTSESVAKAMGTWVKQRITANPFRKLAALALRTAFREIKQTSDPANFGGAPLLGANGIVTIGHGSSSALAARNALRVSMESVEHDLNHLMIEQVQRLPEA